MVGERVLLGWPFWVVWWWERSRGEKRQREVREGCFVVAENKAKRCGSG